MKYELSLPADYTPEALPGRDLWLEALRSGNYQQGNGQLSVCGCDCCLGVLCKVQDRPQVKRNDEYIIFDGHKDLLTEINPVYDWLGASGCFPLGVQIRTWADEGGGHDVHDSLAGCNDAGLTFLQIAEIIEKVWANAEPNW